MSTLTTETLEALRAKGLLSPEDLAQFFNVPLSTIYKWRATGVGPRGLRAGRHVRYTPEAVVAWMEAHADSPQAS